MKTLIIAILLSILTYVYCTYDNVKEDFDDYAHMTFTKISTIFKK